MLHVLGSDVQSSRSQRVQHAGKVHVLALLMCYLENSWTKFYQALKHQFWGLKGKRSCWQLDH